MFRSNGQVTREKLVADINAVVADTDQLLRSLADEGSSQAGEVLAKAEQNLKLARDRLDELEQSVARNTRMAAQTADTYVREHPWQALGAAAGIALLAGFLLRQR